MGLDFSQLDTGNDRWIALPAPLAGVHLRVRHTGPREQERFRKRMAREGILKNGEIAEGRDNDFFIAYARAFILDWKGDIVSKPGDTECPPYTPEVMGKVLGKYTTAFESVTRALGEEADFFPQNGASSTA